MNANAVKLHTLDNVVTVTCDIKANEVVHYIAQDTLQSLVAKSDIPAWNKMSISPIQTNEKIIKYGEIIGKSIQDIAAGMYVSHLNIVSLPRDYEVEMN